VKTENHIAVLLTLLLHLENSGVKYGDNCPNYC